MNYPTFHMLALLSLLSVTIRSMDVENIRESVLDQNAIRVKELIESNPTLANTMNDNKWSLLHTAAFWGDTEIAELLLHHGADIDRQDVYNKTPLHVASCRGHTDFVRLLLQHNAHIDVQNNEGKTPLDNAQKNQHSMVVQLLKDWPLYKTWRIQQLLPSQQQNHTIEQVHQMAEQQRREANRRTRRSVIKKILCYSAIVVPILATAGYTIYRWLNKK